MLLVVVALPSCSRRTTLAQSKSTGARAPVTVSAVDSAAAEEHLRRLGRSIDSLALVARHADQRLQAGIVAELERLRTRRDSTARALDTLRARGRTGLERAKVGADSALGALDRAVNGARRGLRGRPDTLR